jgi:hypothetical protein
VRFGPHKLRLRTHKLRPEALKKFEQHIASFLKSPQHKRLEGWTIEKALFSPHLASEARIALSAKGYTCKDLTDYAGLV